MPRIRCPSLCLVYFPHMWARNWSYELHKTIHHGTQFSPLAITPSRAKAFISYSVSRQESNQQPIIIYSHLEKECASNVWRHLITLNRHTCASEWVTNPTMLSWQVAERKCVSNLIDRKKIVWSIEKIFIGFVSCLKNNWQTSLQEQSISRRCSGQNWGNEWYFTSFHIRTLCN